jgi:hypothetical protein
MNPDATPETIRNTAKAMELAQLLDDRAAHADKARILAWAVEIEPYNLALEDLLNAVRAYYRDPRDRAIGIGDLITGARAIRNDRADREPIQSTPPPAALGEAISTSGIGEIRPRITRPSHRPDGTMNPLSVRCPWCHAGEFRPCKTPGTTVTLRNPHPSRVEAVSK